MFAVRCIGKSLTDLQTFCNIICLQNPVSQKSHDAVNTKSCVATSSAAENSMHNAGLQENPTTYGSTNITVSGEAHGKLGATHHL